MATTIRLVVRLLDGRHQSATIVAANLNATTFTGGFQILQHRFEGGAAVVDMPQAEGLVNIALQRDKNQMSATASYQIDAAGNFQKVGINVDTRIRATRPDGDVTIVEIDLVDSNVIPIDPSAGAFPTSGAGWSWNFPAKKVRVIDDSIERDGEFNFMDTATVTPQVYLFSLRHVPRPKLIAVALPAGKTQVERALLFYHHTIAQNASYYGNAPYPLGAPYIQYGIYEYLSGGRKMAYQLAAANKNLAMVLPVPESGAGDNNEIGDFDKSPALIQGVLEELIAHFNRRFRNDFATPGLKELVLGHYSGGILHTNNLMKSPGPLAKVITEIYDIDGLYSSYGRKLTPTSFAGNGRVIRTYRQGGTEIPKNIPALAGQNIYPISFDRWKKCPSPVSFTLGKGDTLTQAKQGWVHGQAAGSLLYHALSKRKA